MNSLFFWSIRSGFIVFKSSFRSELASQSVRERIDAIDPDHDATEHSSSPPKSRDSELFGSGTCRFTGLELAPAVPDVHPGPLKLISASDNARSNFHP